MSIWTGDFWRASAERSVKSVAYAALSLLIADGSGLLNTNWVDVLSVAGMAGLISILGSIASDAATGGTGPSLTSSETLAGAVTVQAPAEAHVEAAVTMPADDAQHDER